jgi:hypothetical protein
MGEVVIYKENEETKDDRTVQVQRSIKPTDG